MKKPNPTMQDIIADVHAASPFAAPTAAVREQARRERRQWLDTGDMPVAEPDPAEREPVPIIDDPDAYAREFFTRQADRLPDPPLPKPKKPKRGTQPTLIVSNEPSELRDTDEEQ